MKTLGIFAALCLMTYSSAQESTFPPDDETHELPAIQPTPEASDELVTDDIEAPTPPTTKRPCRGHRHRGHFGGGFGPGPFGLFGVGDRGGFGAPRRSGNSFERGNGVGFGQLRRNSDEREIGRRGGNGGRGFGNNFGADGSRGSEGNAFGWPQGRGNGDLNEQLPGNGRSGNRAFGGFEGADFAEQRGNRQRGEFGIPLNSLPGKNERERDIFRGF
ncbi:hypothetical protein AAVH_16803 [Aphelenchoides avenae]|nr:hypothetical protein AAVH_16803 [Aphelenchus avenae]